MSNRILISFQHSVAALVDRRVLLIHAAVCEEIYQTVTSVQPSDLIAESPELTQSHPAALAGQLKDFPLLIRVLTLTDGVEIESPPELIVEWSNIAAICNLSDEEWTVLCPQGDDCLKPVKTEGRVWTCEECGWVGCAACLEMHYEAGHVSDSSNTEGRYGS